MSNRITKPMYPACVLVQRMRDEKGIMFSEMSEIEAETYLIDKNNYLRTASYRKLFEKYTNGVNIGKYIGLDFAYLVELSVIDMHLRYLIEKMCLDIEHALSICLLNLIENDCNEDGYQIVADFLHGNQQVVVSIEKSISSPYIHELAKKYLTISQVVDPESGKTQTSISGFDDCPAWVLIEMLSFGDVIRFYEYYCTVSSKKIFPVPVLNLVRSLRNAVAHNNCILVNLKTGICIPQQTVVKAIKDFPGLSKAKIQKRLSSRIMLEFTALLWVYKSLVGNEMMNHRVSELRKLFNDRMLKNHQYFSKNQMIVSSYRFATTVIDGFFGEYDCQ